MKVPGLPHIQLRPCPSEASKGELVHPHAHLPAVCNPIPENKYNPADDGAEHDSYECVSHFLAPVRAGHETADSI